MPLKQNQQTLAKSAAGHGSRKKPREQSKKQAGRTKRSNPHGISVVKPGSSAKPRQGMTTPQIGHRQIMRTVEALEKQYGVSAEKRTTFEELVRRPTEDGIDLIVAYDWPAIKAVVGSTFNPRLLIRLAVKEKGRLDREKALRAKDARKSSRPDKPEPYRRASRIKTSLRQG